VILGLITSKFPALEDIEQMKRKVYQAAELIAEGAGETREQALNRLGVSPQCGFASHSDGNNVGKEDMIKKLELVRKLADAIWPGQP
jgi:methionine synthase II (cobalamin-independent)